jgi:FkbM family methyltransferase
VLDVSNLSYKRGLIRVLDRPGGRLVLGKLATSYFRRVAGPGVEIAYMDGLWTRKIGTAFFPDGLKFEYAYVHFDAWKRQMEVNASYTRDFWLRHYKPREGDVIVDVGAGRGEDTAEFSRTVGETGRVIAIEAHPLSFEILSKFCSLNRLTNVTPLHLALADRPGTVRIVDSESSWVENAIGPGEGDSGVPVQAATLSDVCRQEGLEDIAFVKMNIEGAERYALPGAEQVIQKVRQICVACHDFRSELGHGEQFRTRAFVERFLTDHGFTLASRPDDPRNFVRDHVFGLRQKSAAC